MKTPGEKAVIGALLLAIAALVFTDIVLDAMEGAPALHLAAEGAAGAGAAAGLAFLLRDRFRSRKALDLEHLRLEAAREEAQRWRQTARVHADGLSAAIEQQLRRWELTTAETEVAFLLLKGHSLKECAAIRNTSEKTIRAQANAIYAKSGLQGRAELAAFFLEDLLPPA